MTGFTFWIARNGRYVMVDAFIGDFDRAEAAALAHVGGGTADSYTRRTTQWMRSLYREPGTVKTVIDGNLIPPRGDMKRGSARDTKVARS